MSGSRVSGIGFGILGLLVVYLIGVASVRLPEITGSYWSAVGATGTLILAYFVQPFRRHASAVIVGLCGGIIFVVVVWMAMTSAPVY